MPTPSQIKTIQLGRRVLGLDDGRYRTLLRSVAGVESCTRLDNAGVEDVLAVMESMGFNSHPGGATYWQDKARRRGSICNERMLHLIGRLAPQQAYALAGLVRRQTGGRTDDPAAMTPAEGWGLIEGLKQIVGREQAAAGQGTGPAAAAGTDAPHRDGAAAATDGGSLFSAAASGRG